jgi:hypothetical protein
MRLPIVFALPVLRITEVIEMRSEKLIAQGADEGGQAGFLLARIWFAVGHHAN